MKFSKSFANFFFETSILPTTLVSINISTEIDDKKENQDAYSIRANFCSSSAASSPLNNDTFLAVYDGHGRFGDKCSSFAKAELPILIERAVHRVVNSKKKAASSTKKKRSSTNDDESSTSTSFLSPSSLSYLSKDEFQAACRQAHLECNKMMHKVSTFDDSLSGTTAISVTFHSRGRGGTDITVCNVGDSRAILGQNSDTNNSSGGGGTFKAIPLSLDQTPYRRDERRRIKATGARIMSLDQIEGFEPIVDSDEEDEDDIQLGEMIDEGGDPPRVWAPNGVYPGTAFTRSLGDLVAEKYGVHAEPEMITRSLSPEDKIIVLASDGVTEFLTNQSVVDICAKFNDPLEACRAVVAESYELWLQYELRTDDITMICVFIDEMQQQQEEEVVPAAEKDNIVALEARESSVRSITSSQSEVQQLDSGGIETLPKEPQKPARCEMSKKCLLELEQRRLDSGKKIVYDDDIDINALMSFKSEDDKARIAEAIKASVIFHDITDQQKDMICSAMEHLDVKKGDWVIRQGEMGDKLYIVEEGEFEVRVLEKGMEDDGAGGSPVHMYFGSRSQHAHPTFGELALRHSAPRQASVIALTDGQLWALHRVVFNKILSYHNTRKEARHHLRKLRAFRLLTQDEMQMVVDNMEEVTYAAENVIVEQGDVGDAFYFIVSGSCGKLQIISPNLLICILNLKKQSFSRLFLSCNVFII